MPRIGDNSSTEKFNSLLSAVSTVAQIRNQQKQNQIQEVLKNAQVESLQSEIKIKGMQTVGDTLETFKKIGFQPSQEQVNEIYNRFVGYTPGPLAKDIVTMSDGTEIPMGSLKLWLEEMRQKGMWNREVFKQGQQNARTETTETGKNARTELQVGGALTASGATTGMATDASNAVNVIKAKTNPGTNTQTNPKATITEGKPGVFGSKVGGSPGMNMAQLEKTIGIDAVKSFEQQYGGTVPESIALAKTTIRDNPDKAGDILAKIYVNHRDLFNSLGIDAFLSSDKKWDKKKLMEYIRKKAGD